jgi:D-glycero-alpha-D-manno-heptose-7-phosphate kinase
MILSRAPFRVSFLGGGSDIPGFYRDYGGAVLSTSIDKYIFLTGREMFDQSETLVKYSKSELVKKVSEIKHPIFREVLKYFDLSGIDIGVSSDIPAGTGLGSSSTFTVALITLVSEIQGRKLSKAEIAKIACEIELEVLGQPIGKQDQYASAFGSFNLIEFDRSGAVQVTPVALSLENCEWLSSSMYLVKLNLPPRSASEIIEASRIAKLDSPSALLATKNLAELAVSGFEEIKKNGVKALPELLRVAWDLKKEANSESAMSVADATVEQGMEAGALGAKLLGAGGGGFVLFLVESCNKGKFLSTFSSRKVLQVATEQTGASILFSER